MKKCILNKRATRLLAKALMCFVLFLINTISTRADQIPPYYFQTVVAIGRTVPHSPTQQGGWQTEASGFFYGYLVKPDPDPAKKEYAVYLVTNRHVLAGHDSIEVRLDPDKESGQPRSFPIALKDHDGNNVWYAIPNSGGCPARS